MYIHNNKDLMEIKDMTRKAKQEVMPQEVINKDKSGESYDLYPFHSLGEGKIFSGFDSLAEWISLHPIVKIDGYVGVDWDTVMARLNESFEAKGLSVNWIRMDDYLKSGSEIESMVKPFLGKEGSVWGKNTTLELGDFFEPDKLSALVTNADFNLNIIVGVGAALAQLDCPMVYL